MAQLPGKAVRAGKKGRWDQLLDVCSVCTAFLLGLLMPQADEGITSPSAPRREKPEPLRAQRRTDVHQSNTPTANPPKREWEQYSSKPHKAADTDQLPWRGQAMLRCVEELEDRG